MKKVLNSSTKFKLSIVKEGMRQLKVFGIAYTVICVLISLIFVLQEFPFIYNSPQHKTVAPQIPWAIDDTIIFLILCSAVFVLGSSILLYNFLRSHKARDFYCSTPNSICTIWLGFVTSIMTWATIGVAAANIIQLPFLMIADVKYFPTWLLIFIGMIAIDLLACGIMSLASAMTGRMISMLVTAAAIFALPFSIYYLATMAFEVFFSRYDFVNVDSVVYYGYMLDSTSSPKFIFGALILGTIYLALAALFMTIRTGDVAGKPFVNKAAHLISLITVSISTTTFILAYLSDEISWALSIDYSGDYITDYIIQYTIKAVLAILAIVFCFWAANVILTFDIKKSHRMLKYLPIPVVMCGVMIGAGFAIFYEDFHTNPSANEIKSFTLVRNEYLNDDLAIYRMSYTHGRTVTETHEFTDKKIINYLANEIDKFIKEYDKDFLSLYRKLGNWDFYTNDEINFKINLKNGRSITRSIPVTDEFIEDLTIAIKNDSEFNKKFFALPDAEYVNIYVSNEHYDEDGIYRVDEIISDEDTVKLYECFAKELASMPAAKRLEYLKSNIYDSYHPDDIYSDQLYYNEENSFVSNSDMMNVSDSDINFVISDMTHQKGEYHASMISCSPTPSLNNIQFMIFGINGYNNGNIYDSQYYFDQEFVLSTNLFPETFSLFTELCNKNMKSFLEIPENLNDESRLHLDAYYYNGENLLEMNYDYINYDCTCDAFYDPFYFYNEVTGKIQPLGVEELKISGKEYVQKLFDDAANTTRIDLNKPYCKLYVSYDTNVKTEYYPIYIQTESLVDLVVNNQNGAKAK